MGYSHTHTYIYTHNPRNIIDIMILVYVIKICPNKAQHHNSTLDFRASHQVGIVLRLQFQGFRDMLLRSDPMGMLPTTGKLRYTRYFWYVFFFYCVKLWFINMFCFLSVMIIRTQENIETCSQDGSLMMFSA